MHRLQWLPINLCHAWYAAMTTLTCLSIPWCCPSMICEVFLGDAYHPRSLLVWSSTAYRGDKHGSATITCDPWRFAVNASDVRRGYWPVAIHIRLFHGLCMICEASSRSICFQSLESPLQICSQRPALTWHEGQILSFCFEKPTTALNYCINTPRQSSLT